jgi:hypothetical protein
VHPDRTRAADGPQELRRQVDAPLEHQVECGAEHGGRGRLRDEAHRAAVECGLDLLGLLGGRYGHHRQRGVLLAQAAQRRPAVSPGHRQVEHDHIDLGVLGQRLERGIARFGFDEGSPGRLEDAFEPLAKDRVVVADRKDRRRFRVKVR